MKKIAVRSLVRTLLAALVVVLTAAPALAHEKRTVNGVDTVVGWDVEPAFAGSTNSAGITVTQGGKGVENLPLKAEILFGDKTSTTKTATLDMAASDETPGHYSVSFVPTRPGTYTFHITGALINGAQFDQYYTSGDKTFDNVDEALQFPVKDPGPGDLNRAVTRLGTKVDSSSKAASTARVFAIVALVFGIIALAAGRASKAKKS
jgi:hypothetical protein